MSKSEELYRNRKKALVRDDFQCQDCGEEVGSKNGELPTAHVHHITPVSEGGSDDVSNLETLCGDCHADEHSNDGHGVGRVMEPPYPDEVYEAMVENRCYVVADLVAEFEDEYGRARGTIRNRLEFLVSDGGYAVVRQEHENGSVTYRREE